MNSQPRRWTSEELVYDARIAADIFRQKRLSEVLAWETNYQKARAEFEAIFSLSEDFKLENLTESRLKEIFKSRLDSALRYLAGPPVSEDDLKTLAEADSLTPRYFDKNPEALRRVFKVIEQIIDPYRFPWVLDNRPPTQEERSAALLASSVLGASQKLATERRNNEKAEQEARVKEYLCSMGFREAKAKDIRTIVQGPRENEFCGESKLGVRKADIVLRLHDTRLMPIECKVSNSKLNSIKRVNNDAAVKARYWNSEFGLSNVVPAAMLSGVFNAANLSQAQSGGLNLFWAHRLDKLGEFIASTK